MEDKPEAEPFVLTPIHGRLLRAIYLLYVASAVQLCRLFYSDGSVKHIKKLLRQLVDHSYLQHDFTPTCEGRSPYHYVLGPAGIQGLRELGCDMNPSLRISQETDKSYIFLQHTLEVNDVIISAMLLKERAPGCCLDSFTHERELKRNPYHTLQQGRSVPVIPDAVLDFRLTLQDSKPARLPVFLEHDRGTEERKSFRRKIRAYGTMIQANGHTTHYVMKRATVLVTTFLGEKRRDQLRGWTLEEFHENTALSKSFLFAAPVRPPDPAQLWRNPCWYPCGVEAQAVELLRD